MIPCGGSNLSKEKQVPKSLQITIDDEVSQGTYINFANIIHSPSEIVIDFGRAVPGRQEVRIHERVIMTPLHAKQFLDALTRNISMFEQKFGVIGPIPNAMSTFDDNEPSN